MEYGIRYKYPHMKPNDVAIWERFMVENPDAYESVDYDLALGGVRNVPDDIDPATRKSVVMLGQRKVDVVGYRSGRVDLIEVKPNAGGTALGQAKMYEKLYRDYIDPTANVRGVVLTDSVSDDVVALAEYMGVTLKVA